MSQPKVPHDGKTLSRARASKPKVKTGCSTCRFVIQKLFKLFTIHCILHHSSHSYIHISRTNHIRYRKRHLKCDESRPECTRCLKAGVPCTGYPADASAKAGPRPGLLSTTRFLLPRGNVVSGLTLARPSSLLFSESEIERRYFQHFQHHTTSHFSMNFDNSLWNRLILQTSRQEPFVRHALVAIGAISKSMQIDPCLRRAYDPVGSIRHRKEMAKSHRNFAFFEYSKSLKEMKELISSGNFSPRQALLASLLSFCFENLLGNRPVALYHAQAGYQVLQAWMSEHPHSISHNVGISSPVPHVVEDDLVHAFAQLDLQIVTIADARGYEFHDSLKHLGDDTVANMPAVFKSTSEARVYWDIVMARSYHFLLTAWEMSRSEELARPFVATSLSHTFITNASKTLHGTPNILTDELLEQYKFYAAEISRWHRAFHPIWTSLSKSTRNKELLMATLILINCIALEIMVAAVAFPDQTTYDEFRPFFQQIIDLIETNVTTEIEKTAEPLHGGLLLDLGITCPLGLVVMRCRDRVIRRRAIAILRSWFNEGPNDALMISKVGTFMMEMEEAGNESGTIPESSRAVPTLYCLDHVNNTILMQFCQRSGGVDGGPVWREKSFDW